MGSRQDAVAIRELERKGDFVVTFARGLAVIEAFRGSHGGLSLGEVAEAAGLDRAVARRMLLTLMALGYVEEEQRRFRLTPRILRLGYSYLASSGLGTLVQPSLEKLAEELSESCSVSVLDGTESVCVAHASSPVYQTGLLLRPGSRWPAYVMASGRVLLSALPDNNVLALLAKSPLERLTKRTIVDRTALLEKIRDVRRNGYALVEQELDNGLLSISVPLQDSSGRIVASLNASSYTSRTDPGTLQRLALPAMARTAEGISALLP